MNPEEIHQIGPYRVRRFIAQGGMAWVFEVADPRFGGHEVVRALKLLKPASAAGEDFERFKNEAGLLAGIDEPNLVTIFDFGKDEETQCFYYTMTYVDGLSMSEYLVENGPFEVDPGIDLFIALLGGLAELHRRNIVHRDIKPANVLLSQDGMRPRLADLGIARVEGSVSHTQTGFAVGTVHYMAPEQARGQVVSAPSDVFSMGLTLFEALTGRLMYDTIDDVDTTNAHEVLGYLVALGRTGEELRVDFTAGGSIPTHLARIIETACRYHADERYADASAMRKALIDFRSGIAPTIPPRRRSRRPYGLAAAAVAVVSVAFFFLFFPDLTGWGPDASKDQLAESLAMQRSELERLEASLPQLVARTTDLSPPPPEELLTLIDIHASEANREFSSATRILETAPGGNLGQLGEGILKLAEESTLAAAKNFRQACQLLLDEYLTTQKTSSDQELDLRVAALRASDAPELAAQEWRSIETQLRALEATPTEDGACHEAEFELGQIETLSEASIQVASMESRFTQLEPELADRERALALKTQRRAEADAVEAPEYQEPMREGREARARGEAAMARKDYGEARRAFMSAAKNFSAAEEIPEAWRTRQQVRELEREVEGRPGIDLRSVSMLVATADGQWENGSRAEAGRTYERAFERMKRLLNAADLRAVVDRSLETALATRESARAAGAPRSAEGLFTQGEEALAAGRREVEADRIDEAAEHLARAEEAFAEARDNAIGAMADARELARRIRRDIETCARYSSATARQDCEGATDALTQGEQDLARLDAPAALRALAPAREILDRAAALQQASLPPEIVAQTPRRQAGSSVEVWRNNRQAFSVEARNRQPDDVLRYAWRYDGQPLATEKGPRIEWVPPRSGRLEVVVEDGRGGRSQAGWDVQVINHAPRIAIQPTPDAQGQVVVRTGTQQTFEARGEDPDNDPVTYAWTLDGKPVGSEKTYVFSGGEVGTHEIAVVARDDLGASTTSSRKILVEREPAEEVVAEQPAPRATQAAEIADANLPAASRRGVQRALTTYARAFETKDMALLKSVWTDLDQKTEKDLKKKQFRPGSAPLSVRVQLREAIPKNDHRFDVVFDQFETSGSAQPKKLTYKASLARSGTGGAWRLTEVGPYLKARRPRVRF